MARARNIILEDIPGRDIPYSLRNFVGEERKNPNNGKLVNSKGDRNFCLLLDHELADELQKEGWNVKHLNPRDGDEEPPRPYLPIKVSYKNIAPKIVTMNSSGRKHILDEDELDQLDHMEIDSFSIKIRPYAWNVEGKTGVKAYLAKLYIRLAEDDLDRKFDNVPVSASDEEELPFN